MDELIPELPRIMKAQGWLRGAALMQGWLDRPASSNPRSGIPDNSTVTMRWVLQYPRAGSVFDSLIRDRIWLNDPAKKLLVQRLIANNRMPLKATGSSREFGQIPDLLCRPAQYMRDMHDQHHVQTRSVQQAGATAPMDDLTAALANFNFHVIPDGVVEYVRRNVASSLYRVSIRNVGIYVRDSYDFNDDSTSWRRPSTWVSQPLGTWGCEANYGGKNPLRGMSLTNKDFREWRAQHGNGRGGDYEVYSDIIWAKVDDAFEFEN